MLTTRERRAIRAEEELRARVRSQMSEAKSQDAAMPVEPALAPTGWLGKGKGCFTASRDWLAKKVVSKALNAPIVLLFVGSALFSMISGGAERYEAHLKSEALRVENLTELHLEIDFRLDTLDRLQAETFSKSDYLVAQAAISGTSTKTAGILSTQDVFSPFFSRFSGSSLPDLLVEATKSSKNSERKDFFTAVNHSRLLHQMLRGMAVEEVQGGYKIKDEDKSFYQRCLGILYRANNRFAAEIAT